MEKTSRVPSPFLVMGLVMAMYVVKVVAKLAIGSYANSPVVTGDGFHNLSDIAEAGIVMLVIAVARRESENFPFGLKKLESFGEIATALSLAFVASGVLVRSFAGLIAPWPWLDASIRSFAVLPTPEPLRVGAPYLALIAGMLVVSIALSFLVGRWQISAGRSSGHDALVADGQETLSDGRLEVAVLGGVVCQYVFGMPWLEYPMAIAVAALMFKTAWEIGRRGVESLLMRSLGREREGELREAMTGVCGIVDVEKLKTFRAGPLTVVIARVATRRPLVGHGDLRAALEEAMAEKLGAKPGDTVKSYVRFALPPTDRHRVAYAVVKRDGAVVISPSLAVATHLRVCDMGHGEIERAVDCPAVGDLAAMLERKRVRVLVTAAPDFAAELRLAQSGIRCEASMHYTPASVGF